MIRYLLFVVLGFAFINANTQLLGKDYTTETWLKAFKSLDRSVNPCNTPSSEYFGVKLDAVEVDRVVQHIAEGPFAEYWGSSFYIEQGPQVFLNSAGKEQDPLMLLKSLGVDRFDSRSYYFDCLNDHREPLTNDWFFIRLFHELDKQDLLHGLNQCFLDEGTFVIGNREQLNSGLTALGEALAIVSPSKKSQVWQFYQASGKDGIWRDYVLKFGRASELPMAEKGYFFWHDYSFHYPIFFLPLELVDDMRSVLEPVITVLDKLSERRKELARDFYQALARRIDIATGRVIIAIQKAFDFRDTNRVVKALLSLDAKKGSLSENDFAMAWGEDYEDYLDLVGEEQFLQQVMHPFYFRSTTMMVSVMPKDDYNGIDFLAELFNEGKLSESMFLNTDWDSVKSEITSLKGLSEKDRSFLSTPVIRSGSLDARKLFYQFFNRLVKVVRALELVREKSFEN